MRKSDKDYKVFRKNSLICTSGRLFQKWKQSWFPDSVTLTLDKDYSNFKITSLAISSSMSR